MSEIKSKIERLSKPGESWALVRDGYYISNFGRWYSAKARQILKQYPNNAGYLRARLNIGCGLKKSYLTHIQVVKFFGDCKGNYILHSTLLEAGLSVDHIDRDKTNNSISNLEIVPHAENCLRYHATLVCAAEGDLPY